MTPDFYLISWKARRVCDGYTSQFDQMKHCTFNPAIEAANSLDLNCRDYCTTDFMNFFHKSTRALVRVHVVRNQLEKYEVEALIEMFLTLAVKDFLVEQMI